jgi:hypothetical protein
LTARTTSPPPPGLRVKTTTATATATATARPRLARYAYAALAVLLIASTIFETGKHGLWAPALIGALAPDLALLIGGGRDLAPGRIHPRAVGVYNAVHRFAPPVALMVAASLAVVPLAFFVLGLAWATHIAVDRALGFGLRDRQGFQRAG